MKIQKTVSLSFILSLAIHFILAIVLFLNSESALDQLRNRKTVEVELIDAEKLLKAAKKNEDHTPKGQIVQQDQRVNDEIAADAKFLSKHNQKVLQETQAALNGQFKNTDDAAGEKKSQKTLGKVAEAQPDKKTQTDKVVKAEKEKEVLTAEDGFVSNGKKPSMKDLMPSFRPTAPQVNAQDLAAGGGEGPSATDDHLKNVKTGMQTLLSTREFLYYSYYNRIRSKLGQYWQPKIREKMERIIKQGRTIASEGDKVTRIVIVLDDRGILQKVQVLGSTGLTDLDDAAVEAFRAAAPFPNPPKGMVDSDGTIKIRWDFILEA